MKKIILLATLLQISISYCQPGGGQGGGGRQGGGNQQNQRPPQNNDREAKVFEEINITEAAGLISYNIEEVIKEVKAKSPKDKESIKRIITEYNTSIAELQKENKLLLEATELNTRIKEKKAIESKDLEQMQEVRKSIHDDLKPIKEKVKASETILNSKMETELTAKIHKKWLKYFEKKKEEIEPRPSKNNNSNFNSNQNQSGTRTARR